MKDLYNKIKDWYNQVYVFFNPPTKKHILREWLETIVVIGVLFFCLRTYVFGLYNVPSGSAEPSILVGDRVLGNKMIYRFWREPKRGDFVIFDNATFVYDTSNRFKIFWQKYIGLPISILGLPAGPDNIVKRIIGLPGDKIEGRVENGKPVIYLNDKKLDEPYVNQLPLLSLNKETGFLNIDSIGPIMLPGFLVKSNRMVRYTYDPKKTLDNQPYYSMTESEVIKNPYTGEPIMELPGTPNIDYVGKTVDNFGPMILPEGKYWVMGDSRKNSYDSRYWGFLDKSFIQGKAVLIIYSIDSEEYIWVFDLLKHPISFWIKNVRWKRTINLL